MSRYRFAVVRGMGVEDWHPEKIVVGCEVEVEPTYLVQEYI